MTVGTDQNDPPIRPLLGPLTNSEQGPSLSFKRGCELRPFLMPDLLDIGGLRVAGGQDYSTTFFESDYLKLSHPCRRSHLTYSF